ncbi:MAG: DUF559 domain-containing protein [Actinomycetota bacterium]
MAYRNTRLLGYARRMRSDPTTAESVLWYHLRRGQMGVRFRRQEPIGPYIVDFVCLSRRLVIETDGDSHKDRERDAMRDQWFLDHGWFVIRFWDDYVLDHTNDTLGLIALALVNPSAVPDPLNRES